MNCKHCGKDFHYCTSCDWDEYASNGYCSQICYEMSGTGKTVYDLINTIVDGIPEPLYQQFYTLMIGDEESNSGALYSIPDGELYLNEYATLRKIGHKQFCKFKLQEAIKIIERRKILEEDKKKTGLIWAYSGISERDIYEKLKLKYGGN